MSFDFLNRPPMPNGLGAPIPNQYVNANNNMRSNPYEMPVQVIQQRPVPAPTPVPQITIDSNAARPKFTIIDNTNDNDPGLITVKNSGPVYSMDESETKPRRRKSTDLATTGGTDIVKPKKSQSETGTVEDLPTSYTYFETTDMLRNIIGDIDNLNAALIQEFNMARSSRTMKNKYSVLIGLSENSSALLSNKINAIKEINSSISKSNELDYKKAKDIKAAQANMNDDAYIADLYKAYISNPQNSIPSPQMPMIDPTAYGSGIVRANIKSSDLNSNAPVDTSYLNYMGNLSPEQRLMQYEGNPNIKQCVVFDAASGNKWFEYMDTSTGSVIPNMPVYDANIMMDTTLDLKNKIAKNINIGEVFPLVVINDKISSEY